jgi:toll-interacting protein
MSKSLARLIKPTNSAPPVALGDLKIHIASAKLQKNYGLSRMDPYVRIVAGSSVLETHTHVNGSIAPVWNQTLTVQLTFGVKCITVEIYQEKKLGLDELVAKAIIDIPASVLDEQSCQKSYTLTGKSGIEGTIDITMSFVKLKSTSLYTTETKPVEVVAPAAMPALLKLPEPILCDLPAYEAPHPPPPDPDFLPAVPRNLTLVEEVQELFPHVDRMVIKTVADANSGNKESTIKSLQQMVS